MTSPQCDFFRANLRPLVNSNQSQVAKAAEISRKHLNRILMGHTNPSLDVACKIAKAVDVPLAVLVLEPSVCDCLKKIPKSAVDSLVTDRLH